MKKYISLFAFIQLFIISEFELIAQNKVFFEQLALDHVVDSIATEKMLAKSNVFCQGLTESKSSSFSILGQCLGLYNIFGVEYNQEREIFFQKDDSLSSVGHNVLNLKLKKPLRKLYCANKKLKERDYLLKVFRAIEYAEKVYVEIQLISSDSTGYIHYFVTINTESIEVTDLCRYWYVF